MAGSLRYHLSAMDSKQLRTTLRAFPDLLDALLLGVDEEQARVRPAQGKWAIVEVVRHLLDEERRDFRPRLAHVLGEDVPWLPVEPEVWAKDDAYLDAPLAETLAAFREERGGSIQWLASLQDPDWERSKAHSILGTLRAGDLLGSWAAHDAVHFAQIARCKVGLVAIDAAPFGIRYAIG